LLNLSSCFQLTSEDVNKDLTAKLTIPKD